MLALPHALAHAVALTASTRLAPPTTLRIFGLVRLSSERGAQDKASPDAPDIAVYPGGLAPDTYLATILRHSSTSATCGPPASW